jgi:hypothetical protein
MARDIETMELASEIEALREVLRAKENRFEALTEFRMFKMTQRTSDYEFAAPRVHQADRPHAN